MCVAIAMIRGAAWISRPGMAPLGSRTEARLSGRQSSNPDLGVRRFGNAAQPSRRHSGRRSRNRGADGFQRIKECNPDVLMVDVRMPTVVDIELPKRLKTRAAKIPVILATTFDDAGMLGDFRSVANRLSAERCLPRKAD